MLVMVGHFYWCPCPWPPSILKKWSSDSRRSGWGSRNCSASTWALLVNSMYHPGISLIGMCNGGFYWIFHPNVVGCIFLCRAFTNLSKSNAGKSSRKCRLNTSISLSKIGSKAANSSHLIKRRRNQFLISDCTGSTDSIQTCFSSGTFLEQGTHAVTASELCLAIIICSFSL